jgi:hypothetical protein
MGLIPLTELPTPIMVLEEAANVPNSVDQATDTIAVEADGIRSIDTDELAARHGVVRVLPQNERAFTAVFVVVSATPAPDAVLDHVGAWAAIFGNRQASSDLSSFETLTGGRATIDTALGPRRSVDDAPSVLRVPMDCDLLAQGCGAGKACFFFQSGNYCGLAGAGLRDEPCTRHTECAPGLECSPNESGDAYACEPYCNLDTTASDACVNVCSAWLLVDDDGVNQGAACQAP